jgi:hypothetical protein
MSTFADSLCLILAAPYVSNIVALNAGDIPLGHSTGRRCL